MSKPLNVLWITSDQQHFSTLGCVNPNISTPALDRLARQGTRFDRAYCNNPTCTPSRATMITGLYPSMHGAWTLGTKLAEDHQTVGDVFTRHGYATSLIGKAHFQPLATAADQTSVECQPTLRDLDFWGSFNDTQTPWYGFAHVEMARNHADEAHAGQHYALWMQQQGLANWRDYFQSWPPDPGVHRREHRWELPEEYHYSVWTAERTMAKIEADVKAGTPFFCWSSFHDPHPPYLVPEPWDTMYDPHRMEPGELVDGELDKMPPHHRMTQDRNADWSVYQETRFDNHGFNYHPVDPQKLKKDMAVYYGMVSLMDREIGRILAKLDELDAARNTLVIFTTDHGYFMGQHGLTAKGAFPYEDVIRVPFIVRWPGHVAAGAVSQALQGLIDMPTTSLQAAGIEVPLGMQGVDQTPVWTGGRDKVRHEVICEFRHQPTAIHLRTYIDQRYKLTLYRDRNYGELFDLVEDPHEVNNRWDDPAAQGLKHELMTRALHMEMRREPIPLVRIAGA